MLTEREQAKRSTCLAFAQRICDLPVEIDHLYAGNFPFNQVAEAVKLPESGNYHDHSRAWDKLYQSFDAVWSEFLNQRTC